MSELFKSFGQPMIRQIAQNPAMVLSRMGLNVPANLNDPNAIIQHLLNSGQVPQQRYNQVMQMVSKMM